MTVLTRELIDLLPVVGAGKLQEKRRLFLYSPSVKWRRTVFVEIRSHYLVLHKPSHAGGSTSEARIIDLDGAVLIEKKNKKEIELRYAVGNGAKQLRKRLVLTCNCKETVSKWKTLIQRTIRTADSAVTKEDFETLYYLGKGHFGSVALAVHKPSGALIGLKEMREEKRLTRDKKNILTGSPMDVIRVEKQIHERQILEYMGDNPWIARLAFAFRDTGKLYLATELAARGDLWSMIRNVKRVNLESARFIIAELVSAVESIHQHGIVHRDIKLENIMLDEGGHVKLVDFGLAKMLQMRPGGKRYGYTFSMCGTSYYMSPEMFKGIGHSLSNDWWQVGCVLYELVVGKPAFYAKGRDTIKDLVLDYGNSDYMTPFESLANKEALSLLRGLLSRDAGDRLGSGPDGAQSVKDHPFFQPVNWQLAAQRKLQPAKTVAAYVAVDGKSNRVLDREILARFFRDSKTKCGEPLNSKLSACEANLSVPLTRDLRTASSSASSTRTEPTPPKGGDSSGPFRGYSYAVETSALVDIGRKLHFEKSICLA